MIDLRPRQGEDGFTLIELLIVLVIIGILLTIAIPAYGGFRERGDLRAAESDLRVAVPSAEAFFHDNDTYVALGNKPKKDPPGITSYDPTIVATVGTGSKGKPTATTYCLNATVGDQTVSLSGPGIQWYTKKNCAGTASSTAP